MSDIDMLASVLSYADRGWAVFPIWPPSFIDGEAVCSCPKGSTCTSKPGKHPHCNWGNGTGSSLFNTAATKDPDTVYRWWSTWPDSNIGVATGPKSGIFVVDVDKRHNGWETLGQYDAEHGFDFDTLRAFTPSGGAHFFYKQPEGVFVKSDDDVLGPGVDIRGDLGMVVVAPSVHANRGRYRWHYQVDPTGPREPSDA